jgi:hypothetical protein
MRTLVHILRNPGGEHMTHTLQSVDLSHGRIRISPNRRFFMHEDGTPFFYLGDTAWEIFHRLNREEVDRYMENRARKRFTIVQAVLLGEIDGVDTPNAYGHLPLIDLDPTRPNEAYFDHVDYVIDKAADMGMYIGLLPTWGAYTVEEKHVFFHDHLLFNPENACTYGSYLGTRYRDRTNIIWILGGDRKPVDREPMWRAMAKGITTGILGKEDYSSIPITYHPWGGSSSADFIHDERWLSFNMLQSGHNADSKPYEMIAKDYARTPVKPCMNGEPGYEMIPGNINPANPKLNHHDTRKFAYWSVFAGGCGHTYGAHEMWMMWSPAIEPITEKCKPFCGASIPWYEAMDYAGAAQMQHLRSLIESRPFFTRIPDQSLIISGNGEGNDHVQACRDENGAYAFIYSTSGNPVTVATGKISGSTINAWWFDPRTGAAQSAGSFPSCKERLFTPPSQGFGNDWVLVLDDASRGFGNLTADS